MKRLSDVMPPSADNEGARAYPGLYKGQVTNNNDDAKRGRLKLSIPQVTGDAEHPVWAEPVGLAMTPGKGYGSIDLPQKNDWVWVEFEGGNPAYPRWRHGWWADDELPEPFKANYPEVRGFKTKGGHVFFVDDKDGKLHFEHADGAAPSGCDSRNRTSLLEPIRVRRRRAAMPATERRLSTASAPPTGGERYRRTRLAGHAARLRVRRTAARGAEG